MSREAFQALADEFVDISWRLDPVFATACGIHDYDDELGDPSRGTVGRRIDWLHEMERRLGQEVDESALTAEERIDCRYLRSRLRAGLLIWEVQREAERAPFLYPDTCLLGIFLLFARDFAPLAERREPLLRRLERVRPYLETARTTVTEAPRLFAEIAAETAEVGTGFVEELRVVLRREFPADGERIEAACGDATRGFRDYAEWAGRDLAGRPEPSFAVGREVFEARLRDEHLLTQDADSLEALGARVLRETQAEMDRVAHAIAPGKAWTQLVDETIDRHPDPERLLDAYREEMRRVRAFVVERRLAPIPDGEQLEIIDTPVFERSRTPYAAYLQPGPFDAVQKGLFYVTPVDRSRPPAEQREQLRGHNRHSLPLTCLHEAYPGHHLQLCWANRSGGRLRKLADSAVLAEGWALYCEEMMHEQGYYADPLVRLYQLKDLCWRAARVVIDCRLQTGRMSFDEAVDFLVAEARLERANAEGEVRRYATTPTQPLSYLVGKLLLLDLRQEVQRAQGARFQLHDFHAAVLQAGTLPVPLVSAAVRARLGIGS